MKQEIHVVWIMFGVPFLIFVGFIYGALWASGVNNESAIKAGVAEYYLDEKFEKKFRWKTLPNAESKP